MRPVPPTPVALLNPEFANAAPRLNTTAFWVMTMKAPSVASAVALCLMRVFAEGAHRGGAPGLDRRCARGATEAVVGSVLREHTDDAVEAAVRGAVTEVDDQRVLDAVRVVAGLGLHHGGLEDLRRRLRADAERVPGRGRRRALDVRAAAGPATPGDTPVATLPLVFAMPKPMLITSATCTMSTWLPSSALTNAACETLFVALTPVAFASPSDTDDELLVPVVVDAPPVVVPAFAPATAPIEVLPPELPEALEPVQTFATLCCSAAFVDELDEALAEDEQRAVSGRRAVLDASALLPPRWPTEAA